MSRPELTSNQSFSPFVFCLGPQTKTVEYIPFCVFYKTDFMELMNGQLGTFYLLLSSDKNGENVSFMNLRRPA